MPTFKHCQKCLKLKSLDDFYKDNSRYDLHGTWCKECEVAQDKLRDEGRTDPKKKRKK